MKNEVNRALEAKKKFNFINQKNRRGSGTNLNLFRYAAMVIMLLTLGVGNAWAGDPTYKTDFKATGGATGKGYVYAGTSNTATPVYVETSDDIAESSDTKSATGTNNYYAWAKAVRGSEFAGWTITGSNGGVTPASGTASPITVTVTSNKSNGTNTGTATATWTTYAKVNVTYNPSEDGIYSVTYQYNSYNTTTKEITTGDAENLNSTITSENGAQTIGSYKNDVITLESTSGTFQGWYSDAGFGSLLSTANPYTYTAPTSGSAAVYPKYEHVDKYYGRLTASIAAVPYSMPGGGTIFVSKEETGTGTYSADAQTVDNIGMGTKNLKYYLHALSTDKRYVFRGWYSNPECTGTVLSTNADYTYTFTASSMNSASPTTGNVYAAFDFNLYYMQVEAEPAVPGLGMVFVSDTKLATAPEYTAFSTHAEQITYAYRLRPTADVYLYAKPKYGYKLAGWYTDVDCTVAASVAADGKYTATGSSTDPMNPTITTLYAKFIEDATTVNITYNKPDQTKGEYTASVLDIAEVDDEFVWTFTEVYNSVGKTGNTVHAHPKTDVLQLEAQPKAGYGVASWTIAGAAKTTPSQLYETTGTAAATYGVTFGDATPFLVCATTAATTGTAYSTFRDALDNLGTNKKIVVVQNAYVPAGNYTIPSGVTLLIPHDETYTVKTTEPNHSNTNKGTASVYRQLTLSDGVTLTVNGDICVGGEQIFSAGGGNMSGYTNGKYGQLIVEDNCIINLHGNLYSWGFVTGGGHIYAFSGSKVYEPLQLDFRGGSYCNTNYKQVFVANQYYVQNIETLLTFYPGSSETVFTGIFINTGSVEVAKAAPFIADNGLFKINTGSLTRHYDFNNDRQIYDIDGDTQLQGIELELYNGMLISVILNSKIVVLPLTNNMIINIHSGTTSIMYDAEMLADAKIVIDEGATIKSRSKVYVYDSDDYKGKTIGLNGDINTVPYSPTKKTSRSTVSDAKIEVNGTLEMYTDGSYKGYIYTTPKGADICSSGSGIIKLANGAGDATSFKENKGTSAPQNISITAAKLHNGDDSYTATAGSVANDQFIYNKQQEKWLKNPKVVSWNANGGTTEASTMAYSEGSFVGELPAAYKDGYTLEGWYNAADGGTQIEPTTKVTANATYYAHWTQKSYTITYRDNGGAPFSGTHVDSPNAHPTTHTFGTATALNGATQEHYTFGGWYRTPSCSGTQVSSLGATEVTKDITLYAKWTEAPNTYAITYDKGAYGTGSIAAGEKTHDVSFTLSSEKFTRTGYTQTGWSTSDGGAKAYELGGSYTANAAITLYPFWTIDTYAITYNKGANGTGNIAAGEKTYGVAFTLSSEKFTRDGYTQTGWSTSDGGAKAYDLGGSYTANAAITLYPFWVKTYTITWKVDGKDDETTTVEAGQNPVYPHGRPEKESEKDYTFECTGWSDGTNTYALNALPEVEKDVTYTAQFQAHVRYYTIIWKNWDGEVLETDGEPEMQYGAQVSYDGATPTKPSDGIHNYAFKGWDPEVTAETKVAGDQVYTAQFGMALIVGSNDVYNVDGVENPTSTTVYVAGKLNVPSGNSLNTVDLYLEASADGSGEISGPENVTVTGKAYFDLKLNTWARHWHAFGVPWPVGSLFDTKLIEVKTKNGETCHNELVLGRDYDIIHYNGETRASQGPGRHCWDYVENGDGTLTPGKAYMIGFIKPVGTIRFTKASGVAISSTEPLQVVNYSGSESDHGWNAIANPKTVHALLDAGVEFCQVQNGDTVKSDRYTPYRLTSYKFVVGTAVYVQVTGDKEVGFSAPGSITDVIGGPLSAPRRQVASRDESKYFEVHLLADGKSADRIYIKADASKEEDVYTTGIDVAKMGVSTMAPQMWVDRYDNKLAVNTVAPVNESASYPLSLFAPQAGEYTISSDATTEDNVVLYLTFDGRPLWNLTYAPYVGNLEKGTTQHYGLLLVRRNVPTDIDAIQAGEQQPVAQKILLNGQVLIPLGLAGAVCNMAGSWVGSGLAISKGARIVRPVILLVLLLLLVKILFGI